MARSRVALLVLAAALLSSQFAFAGTQGHYYPGVMGMRDIIVPPKGLYTLFYDPFYYSNDYRNANGNEIGTISATASTTKIVNIRGREIPVRLTGTLTADIDMTMNFVMQELLLVWVPGWKALGADFAMMIVPSGGYVGIDIKAKASAVGTISIGDFSKTVVRNETVEAKNGIYGFGDLLVQPVMLDWRGKNYDLGLNYGFFAPTGAYSENRLANVGMGFWTQQFQAFGAYYFDKYRKTAAVLVATYNLNSRQYDKDLVPGQSMTIEYGIDHYLNDRVAIGVSGYDQWQISPDAGTAARNKSVFYQIHAVGGQMTGWIIKDKLNVTTKCMYEYYGADRFSGILATANLIWVF